MSELKGQLAFEKKVWSKTARTNARVDGKRHKHTNTARTHRHGTLRRAGHITYMACYDQGYDVMRRM